MSEMDGYWEALAAPWLYLRSRAWFTGGMAVNAVLAALLPIAAIWPDAIDVRGAPLFERTMGARELSEAALDTARAEGLSAIAASDRKILADLFYRAKGTGIAIYAWPVPEVPDSHYALTRPLTEAAGPVLFVTKTPPEGCAGLRPVSVWSSGKGTDRVNDVTFAVMERPCP